MSVIRIATRYAKSLMDLAIEQNKLAGVSADINLIATAVHHRDLYMMLKSPIIHADKKNAVLEAIFKSKVDALTMAYLELLVNKGREAYLPEIAAEFVRQYKVMQNITTVTVTTASEMTESVLAELKKQLLASGATTEKLDVITKIDPELIGGFVLEFDNKRFDASVAQKLEDLKNTFSKNLYIKEF
ncbi:MAG: ATP synthase F1 subunit delta [Saprospiraceae bacterium]|nr:ATP synthase F1 subunit delta [Saprospiraceae bacterium]